MWSRCASTPPRSPPNHSYGVSGPRPVGSSSQRARNGPLRRVVAGARRRESVRKDLVHDRPEVPCGPAGIEREHEVVRVGNVVTERGRGRSATRSRARRRKAASGSERAGSRTGKRARPPAVARPALPRLRGPRRPRPSALQRPRRHRERGCGRLLRRRARSVARDIDVRAVVVRLVEERCRRRQLSCSSLDGARGQSLHDVALEEHEEERWREPRRSARLPRTAPSASEYFWSMYCEQPDRQRELLSGVWRMTLAITNSLRSR